MTYYHPIWSAPNAAELGRGPGRRGEGGRARGRHGAGARVHRRDQRLLPRFRDPAPRRAGGRLRGLHPRRVAPIPGRPRSHDLLRAAAVRALERSGLRPAEEGSRDPERAACGRAAASGHHALHDPRVRLPAARARGAAGRALLREDRARLAPRAPHAVAHLHAPRAVAGVHRLEHRLGRRGPAPRRRAASRRLLVRRDARPGLPRVRVPPDRRRREGARGVRRGRRGVEVRRGPVRRGIRPARDPGALDARAPRLEGRRRPPPAGGRASLGAVLLRSRHDVLRAGGRRRAFGSARPGPCRRSASSRTSRLPSPAPRRPATTGRARSRPCGWRRRRGSPTARAGRTRRCCSRARARTWKTRPASTR